MGSQYSVGPFPRDVHCLVNMDLIQLQSKIYRFERLLDRYHNDNVFINRKQFQWTFQFSDIISYKLFQKFDPECKGYMAAYDLWCALALASTAQTSDKINFLFYLIDLNHDNYISSLDLTLILRCATRGFANLKGIIHVPIKTINVLVKEAFQRVGVILNEAGEISLRDLRPYFLIDDKPRTYLSNLGTLIVVEDSSKLIEQRAELLKELAEVELELNKVEARYHAKKSDREAYETERGGDSSLVRLTEKLLANMTKQEAEKPQDKLNLTSEEKQRLRREQRLLQAVGEGDDEEDENAEVNDDRVTLRDGGAFSRGCKPIAMTGSGGSESAILEAILFKWTTLKPQSSDKLVKLDLDSLLDLFEAAGITVSDEHALQCLNSLPCNLIGRHNVQDVIVWLRRHTIDTVASQKRLPMWRKELFQYREQFLGWIEWFQEWLRKINYQDLSSKEVRTYAKRLQEKSTENDDLSSLSSQVTASKITAGPLSNNKKGPKSSSFEKIIKGSIRLSGWQRHRQMSKPTKCGFLATFGPPIVQKAATTPKKQSNSITSILKKQTDPKPEYKGKISLEFFTKAEGKKRESLLSGDGIVRDFETVTPGDLMHHFDQVGYVVELSEAELASEAAYAAARAAGLNMSGSSAPSTGAKPSSFVAWFLFRVSDKATAQEAFCLLKTATNFFESIPLDYRHEIYTSTKGQLFYLEPNNKLTPMTPGQSTEKQCPRVICVALLHERDPFKAVEDQIKSPNLLFTRALRSLKVDIRLLRTLKEMYEESTEYDNFQDKLFGPQEDELGEEGMNPLRFAKMCRKRQVAAQEAIEKAPKMPLEELKTHLSTRGLSTKGTKEELISRVQAAFKQQIEMIGYGEMSGFGATMVKRIFELFDEDHDGAFSLMEMNKFLLATGAEAFYDSKAYKSMMLEEGFLLDSHYRLTLEGLIAYYERYGRLARDIRMLGLGSFSQTGQGEIEMRLEYEADAIYSLYNILEPNTLVHRLLKHILGTISSTNDVLLTGNFPKLDDLFRFFKCEKLPYLKQIVDGIQTPGWISQLLHFVCEWLADGENGLIPSLRANSRTKFNNYSSFTKNYQKFTTVVPEMKNHPRDPDHDDEENSVDASQRSGASGPGPGQSSHSSSSQSPQVEDIDAYLADNSLRKQYISMFQIFYKNNKIQPIDVINHPTPGTTTGAGSTTR